MIVLYILGYFCRNKQNSYAALICKLQYICNYNTFVYIMFSVNNKIEQSIAAYTYQSLKLCSALAEKQNM